MSIRVLKTGIVAIAVLIAGATTAFSATVTINTIDGQAHQTVSGIRDDTATRGADLVGATVHVVYTDGSEEDLTFTAPDPWSGSEVNGSGFHLGFSWGPLTLSATQRLASMSFDLIPANSLFDISTALEGQPGNTPTSGIGSPFSIASGLEGDAAGVIGVTYSGIVNLAGSDPAGDLYTTMLLDFTGLTGGGFLGDMSWRTDMDTLRYAGDLNPVPLPAGLPLLAAGLAGFGLIGARRKRA